MAIRTDFKVVNSAEVGNDCLWKSDLVFRGLLCKHDSFYQGNKEIFTNQKSDH